MVGMNILSDKRIFSFSEVYGPFSCEGKEGCTGEAWDCILSKEDYDALPISKEGYEASHYILKNGIGKMLCSECLEKTLVELG